VQKKKQEARSTTRLVERGFPFLFGSYGGAGSNTRHYRKKARECRSTFSHTAQPQKHGIEKIVEKKKPCGRNWVIRKSQNRVEETTQKQKKFKCLLCGCGELHGTDHRARARIKSGGGASRTKRIWSMYGSTMGNRPHREKRVRKAASSSA